ncbi:MAG: DUF21 domain-containing protein, partial [Pseudomonadota bacterium]|nr:DUF21 domain-containing protein [Pseudomonadota bacterium]
MTLALAALVIFFCLIGAAFFSAAETSLTAASRARLQALETAGDKRAALANRLTGNKGRLISAMLLGGQLVTIAATAYTTSIFVETLGRHGELIATAVMTVLIVVFGEVLPKTIAIAYPDRVALTIVPIVAFFVTVFGPIVHAVELFVRFVLNLGGVGLTDRDPSLTGAEELRGAVDMLHREGEVARDQRDMFGGLLELEEVPVGDVMIHRTKMRTLNADLPPADLVAEALASPYTRMPLWRGDPDNIIGILHIKDLFRAYAAAGGDVTKLRPADIALDAWFIPDATSCRAQLQAFLRRKTHSALVVDEYGAVMGL